MHEYWFLYNTVVDRKITKKITRINYLSKYKLVKRDNAYVYDILWIFTVIVYVLFACVKYRSLFFLLML